MDGRSGLDTLDRLDALCRELHPLTCAEPALRPALARHAGALRGLAGRDAGAEAVARDTDALWALAAAHRTGGSLDGPAAALDPPAADAAYACAAAEGAAGGAAHPVARAARVFAAAAGALGDGGPLRPLPWALASLALLGAGRPPLVADRGIGPRLAASSAAANAGAAAGEEALTRLFIDLQLAQLRERLTGATTAPSSASAPLAASVHRSLAAHLDRRCGPLRLVLRELDPDARVEVDSGNHADGPDAVRSDRAAARVLVRPGPASPWVRMRMRTKGAGADLLVAVRDVGDPPTGALAVVADAEFSGTAGTAGADEAADTVGAGGAGGAGGTGGAEGAPPENPAGATDCVTLVPGDSAGGRRPDIEAFLDDALSRAVDHLTRTAAFDHV